MMPAPRGELRVALYVRLSGYHERTVGHALSEMGDNQKNRDIQLPAI